METNITEHPPVGHPPVREYTLTTKDVAAYLDVSDDTARSYLSYDWLKQSRGTGGFILVLRRRSRNKGSGGVYRAHPDYLLYLRAIMLPKN